VNFAITPATLAVTVTGSQAYGGSPLFTPAYSGFFNGDDSSIVTGSLTCLTDATALEPGARTRSRPARA